MKIINYSPILILFFLTLPASAKSCDRLSYTVDEARSKLRRAAGETELESAKDAARRAKNALEDAAYAARDCECNSAYSDLTMQLQKQEELEMRIAQQLFDSIEEVQEFATQWMWNYNHERPHMALGCITLYQRRAMTA